MTGGEAQQAVDWLMNAWEQISRFGDSVATSVLVSIFSLFSNAGEPVSHNFKCFESPLPVLESQFMLGAIGVPEPVLTDTPSRFTVNIPRLRVEQFLIDAISRNPELHSEWPGFTRTLAELQRRDGAVTYAELRPDEFRMLEAWRDWKLRTDKEDPRAYLNSEHFGMTSMEFALTKIQQAAFFAHWSRITEGQQSKNVYLMVSGRSDPRIGDGLNSARAFYALDGSVLSGLCSSEP